MPTERLASARLAAAAPGRRGGGGCARTRGCPRRARPSRASRCLRGRATRRCARAPTRSRRRPHGFAGARRQRLAAGTDNRRRVGVSRRQRVTGPGARTNSRRRDSRVLAPLSTADVAPSSRGPPTALAGAQPRRSSSPWRLRLVLRARSDGDRLSHAEFPPRAGARPPEPKWILSLNWTRSQRRSYAQHARSGRHRLRRLVSRRYTRGPVEDPAGVQGRWWEDPRSPAADGRLFASLLSPLHPECPAGRCGVSHAVRQRRQRRGRRNPRVPTARQTALLGAGLREGRGRGGHPHQPLRARAALEQNHTYIGAGETLVDDHWAASLAQSLFENR